MPVDGLELIRSTRAYAIQGGFVVHPKLRGRYAPNAPEFHVVWPQRSRSMTIPSQTNQTIRPSPNTAPSTSRAGIAVTSPATPATMPR